MKFSYWTFFVGGLFFMAAGVFDGAAAAWVGCLALRLAPSEEHEDTARMDWILSGSKSTRADVDSAMNADPNTP